MCVLFAGHRRRQHCRGRGELKPLVCVCASTYTRTPPGGWQFLRGGRFAKTPCLSCCATPFPRVAQPPPAPAPGCGSKSITRGRGARPRAVHLRDIVSPYSTGWGDVQQCLRACGVVGCIDYKAVPDWLDPAECEKAKRAPPVNRISRSFAPLPLVPCSAAPWRGGGGWGDRRYAIEPQLWARPCKP